MLDEIAEHAGDTPPRVRVLTFDAGTAHQRAGNRRGAAAQVDEVFALVARHPLLTRQQLASLLRTSSARIGRLEADLVARGWLRLVGSDEFTHGYTPVALKRLQRLGLVELSDTGRREAARRLLVPAGIARRRHGVTGSPFSSSSRRFLRQLEHTLGTNAFFVGLASAAVQVTSRGGSDALLEWRSAAACARGRFRPDGYGCYRRGPSRFGFFLEYDRGTEKPTQYAAKLATYYRYRNSNAFRRDYQSFPTLLVVTTSERAEERFSHQAYLAQHRHAAVPLRVFLTTTESHTRRPEGGPGRNLARSRPRLGCHVQCARVLAAQARIG